MAHFCVDNCAATHKWAGVLLKLTLLATGNCSHAAALGHHQANGGMGKKIKSIMEKTCIIAFLTSLPARTVRAFHANQKALSPLLCSFAPKGPAQPAALHMHTPRRCFPLMMPTHIPNTMGCLAMPFALHHYSRRLPTKGCVSVTQHCEQSIDILTLPH